MNSHNLKEGRDPENARNELQEEFEILLKKQNSYVIFANQGSVPVLSCIF